MKSWFKQGVAAAAFSLLGGILFAQTAFAMTPNFTAQSTGSGDNVAVTVYGDANSSVNLFYNIASSAGMQVRTLGDTDSNGNFSTTFSSGGYGVNAGQTAYVTVNGQQSQTLTWPYTNGSSGGITNPQITQTNVVLNISQSVTLSSYGSSNTIFLAGNSSPSVATVAVSGTQISITGLNTGLTTATVCYQSNSSYCTNIYITVASGQTIAFGQSSVSLSGVGKYASVSITGGTGDYYISSNSNPSAVQATIVGSTVGITSLSGSGSSVLSICTTGGSSVCGMLTVNLSGSGSTGSVLFSQTNPVINPGQTTYVYLSGGVQPYSLPSYTSNIVSASLSGTTLTLYGANTGSGTATVCGADGSCSTLYLTVGTSGSTGAVVFSQTNPVIVPGQTSYIYLSGGSQPYSLSTYTTGVVQASLSGTTLTLYGSSVGSGSVVVCAASGGCSTLYLTVSSTGGSGTTLTAGPVVSVGQQIQMTISGGTQPYSVSYGTGAVSASVSGSTLTIQGLAQGSATLSVCGASGGCLTLPVAVNGAISTTPVGSSGSSGKYLFYNPLTLGASGTDVTALQNRLTEDGYYSGPVTGYYGSLTEAAVKAFQRAHGLSALGNVGPATRASLNQ